VFTNDSDSVCAQLAKQHGKPKAKVLLLRLQIHWRAPARVSHPHDQTDWRVCSKPDFSPAARK
jgi:hypothetical protein